MTVRLSRGYLDLVGRCVGGAVVRQELPERDSGGNRRWLCDCQCNRSMVKTSLAILDAERRGAPLRCAACIRADRQASTAKRNRVRDDRHRQQWRETGTLYTYEWEVQAERVLREDMAKALGFWPEETGPGRS